MASFYYGRAPMMLAWLLVGTFAIVLGAEVRAASPTGLSPADEVAVFKVAGFVKKGKDWRGTARIPGRPPTCRR